MTGVLIHPTGCHQAGHCQASSCFSVICKILYIFVSFVCYDECCCIILCCCLWQLYTSDRRVCQARSRTYTTSRASLAVCSHHSIHPGIRSSIWWCSCCCCCCCRTFIIDWVVHLTNLNSDGFRMAFVMAVQVGELRRWSLEGVKFLGLEMLQFGAFL